MPQIILFFLIFGVIVISHEFGHFLLAKVNGITVVEFSVGMGPVIAKFEKNGTKYALKALPIGGACLFEGEDGIYTNNEGEKKPGAFPNAKVGARIATVLEIFNFLLAFIFSLFLVGNVGSDPAILGEIMEEYPAEEAGLLPGDEILRMNGERVYLYREISIISMLNQGEDIVIEYKRGDETYETVVTPKFDVEANRYYIGFTGGNYYVKGSGFDIIVNSVHEVRYIIKMTYKSLLMLFQGQASIKDLSGPVGMAQVVGEVYKESASINIRAVVLSMLNIAILLSANIGVVNLLPLPALDGGRLIFLLIELVRGKPISQEKEGIVHFIGFVLLMLLMVVVMYNDILRLFG